MTRPRSTTRLVGVAVAAAVLASSLPLNARQRLVVRPSNADAAFVDFLERYARGQAVVGTGTDAAVLEFSRTLRRVGSRWAGPRESPEGGRRRLVVATMALDVIDQHFATAWGAGRAGDLLEWACGLLREMPARPAERAWHLAAIALLERASASRLIRGPVSQRNTTSRFVTHVMHAEERFPGDGEWLLARAVDAEHAVWPPVLGETVLRPTPDDENRIRSRLRAAFDHPLVQGEAHLRWGYFHLRRGRFGEALAEFDAAGEPDDRVLRFWRHLFRGQTYARMTRWPDAIEAYRFARAESPDARSATLALGAALARQGQADEARALADGVLRQPPGADPWLYYGEPAARHWPTLAGELRKAFAP